MIYFSLFLTSFVAATLFPAASEAMLATLVSKQYHLWLLWLAATSGNVIGSIVNWWLGRKLNRFQDRTWFPFNKKQMHQAQQQFQKYGVYSLLFAWLPIVGDPLTLIAGIMKVRFLLFLLLVSVGKALRYAIVILIAANYLYQSH